jgi:hypothetical protein
MKREYESPEIEIEEFIVEDIIADSSWISDWDWSEITID